MSRIIISFAIMLLYIVPAKGEIILSEILSNEPSNRVLLEWIELYNNSVNQVDLHDYLLMDDDDTLNFPVGTIVLPYTYTVLCRRLEPSDGSDCFEYYWGDSSGVWGDAAIEDYTAYEVNITLTNSAGELYLLNSDSLIIDQYNWDTPSDDGRSVERDDVDNLGSSWHPCYDPAGSTPGHENSEKPTDNEEIYFQIEPQLISLSGVNRTFAISYAVPGNSKVSLTIYDDSAYKTAELLDEVNSPFGLVEWNAVDDNNRPLSPGLYIVSFKVEGSINKQSNIPVVIAP